MMKGEHLRLSRVLETMMKKLYAVGVLKKNNQNIKVVIKNLQKLIRYSKIL